MVAGGCGLGAGGRSAGRGGGGRGRAGRRFYCQAQANSVCAGVGGGAAIKLKKFQGLYIRAFQIFSRPNFSGFPFRFRSPPQGSAGATRKFSLLPTLAFSKSGAGLRKTENAGTPQGQPVPQFIQFYINSSFPRRCRCRSGHPLRGARTTALRQTTLKAHLPYFLP